ncbi:MAG: helix-turn-helix domain-containing protein [Candidatus Latescibacteria bacterium]|nr:helix-turn-helix domain-containing protein [Candidatus Latescibacterota bacterium]
MILHAATGARLQHIAATLDLHRDTVRTWRQRWHEASIRGGRVEAEADATALRQVIQTVLADAPRSGAPATFHAEQICQIIAVACEPVEASGRPVSHWTPQELAAEVITRGIVPWISPCQVGRLLKGGGLTAPSGRVLAASRPRP